MYNQLILNVLGGGNFGSSKLTSNHRVLIKGRIAAWIQSLVFVLFAFSFSACSSDENAENSEEIDYKTQISAHEWEISSAEQRQESFFIDAKKTPTYCRFTNDSIYFSEKEMVTTLMRMVKSPRAVTKSALVEAILTPFRKTKSR